MSNVTTDFVIAARKILEEIRKILTTLHLVREDVKAIREQAISTSNAQTTNQETSNPNTGQANRSPGRSEVLDVDKTNRHKKESEEDAEPYLSALKKRLEKHLRRPRFIIEVLALLGLFTYTCETRRTNNFTQEAIRDARENFIKDHAPYIWVSPQPPIFKFNEKFRWDVQYSNYGRSPALDLHSCATGGYGPAGLLALKTVKLPDINGPECNPAWRSISVAPPGTGFIGYTTAMGDKPLAQGDIDTIKSTDGGALVLGVIEYSDATGHTYDSVFCAYRLQSGALMNCERFNYIRQTK